MIKNFNRQQNRHVPLNNYREIEDAATSSSRDSNPRPSDPSWLVVSFYVTIIIKKQYNVKPS